MGVFLLSEFPPCESSAAKAPVEMIAIAAVAVRSALIENDLCMLVTCWFGLELRVKLFELGDAADSASH
jgi:hypothetical protein